MSETPLDSPVPFSLSRSARTVISVASLLAVLLALPRALALPEVAESVGYVLGVLMVMILLPLGAGWGHLKLGPNDHAGAQRTVSVTAVLLLAVRVVSMITARASEDPGATMSQAVREIEALRRSGDPAAQAKAADRAVEAFGAMAQVEGNEWMAEFTASLNALRAQHDSFHARLGAFMDGVDRPAAFDSREKIDARLELLRQAHDEGVALISRIEAWLVESEAKVKGPHREAFLTGLRRGWESQGRVGLQLRKVEVQMLESYREMFGLLREHLEQWQPDPAGGLRFAEGFPKDAFEAVLAKLEAANVEMERLDAQLERAAAASPDHAP